jgi:hypothetical protein
VQDVVLPEAFSNTANIKFGFTAGTGAFNNYHEISNLRVKTLDKKLPYRELASSEYLSSTDGLANTGGSLSDYYLLIASAFLLIGAGIISKRKVAKK